MVQAIGQLNYLRPFVTEPSLYWLIENSIALSAGAMVLTFLASEIEKLKLGNGTSILIFVNILSLAPSSLSVTVQQLMTYNPEAIFISSAAFVIAMLGIVYVQEAERKIPINYATPYCGALDKSK